MSNVIEIPFFPLNIFLLPGEMVPLHIFEPRYKQLMEDMNNKEAKFALPFKGESIGNGLASICRLSEITEKYENGESDVVIEALEVAKIKSFEGSIKGKLYPGGSVERMNIELVYGKPDKPLLEAAWRYVSLSGQATQIGLAELAFYNILEIAVIAKLSSEEKLKLVSFTSGAKLQWYLTQILAYLALLHKQEAKTEYGFLLN